MRIFVVGTGRCGTCTTYQALRHVEGYTVGHESLAGTVESREYPDNHIEVSSQLVPVIPLLKIKYPKSKYLFLIRDRISTINSLVRECPDALRYYARLYYQSDVSSKHSSEEYRKQLSIVAGFYYDNTNSLIDCLLDKTKTQRLHIEHAHVASIWRMCWDFFNFQGNFESSLGEWSKKYNASGFRGRDNYSE